MRPFPRQSFRNRPHREDTLSAFDAHFQTSPLAAFRHERRGGGTLSTRLIQLTSPAHDVVDPPTDELVMGLMLQSRGGAVWAWDGARANHTPFRRPGTLGLTPIGAQGRFEIAGPSRTLIVCLPYAALARRLEPELQVPRDFGALHDNYVDHPFARQAAMRLWRAARRESFGRDLLIDALSERLLLILSDRTTESIKAPFDHSEQARVAACAEQPDIDVAGLAASLSMPVRTFRRRFTATFGTAPHHWLTQRRIERARRMLSEQSLSLSETALDLGFASQAHFTEAFRHATGTTPGRYRRDHAR